MKSSVRIQLSTMMFLEYFIWGVWYVTMGIYLTKIGFHGKEVGAAYSTLAIGAIISSFFVSMVADRYFAAEKLTGLLHLLAGCTMFIVSRITDPAYFFWVLLLYMIFYMPTIALTNAISFHQTTEAGREFPRIRVLGTIGWIVAGLTISVLNIETGPQPMQLAAVFSILMGIFCFFLPHTPPKSTGKKVLIKDILGLDALKLMKSRSFVVLIVCTLLITLPFAMYHQFTNMVLNETGIENAAGKMTLGQMSEVVFMIIMPWFFIRLGIKRMALLGMAAWVVRYLLFSFGNNAELVFFFYIGILLHGICFDFFYVTGQIYVDKKAPVDVRAGVQGFYTLITYGVGWLLGTLISGVVLEKYQITDASQTVTGHNWPAVMLVPAIIAGVVLVVFWIFFQEGKEKVKIEKPLI
jgi:nucleoside transporter